MRSEASKVFNYLEGSRSISPLKNEQDVELFERLAFMARREQRGN